MSWSLQTKVEIAAPLHVVREKLLDFASIPEYSPNGFVKAITPLSPNQSLNPGDQVAVDIARGKFTSTITTNTPEELTWKGGLPYLFTIIHTFRFAKSKENEAWTTFSQEETFSGMFGWYAGIFQKADFEREYSAFNQDLKKWLERDRSVTQ